MFHVYQSTAHDPANGKWGDCQRAVIASWMELDLEEVPHFFDQGRPLAEAMTMLYEFLANYGCGYITIPFTGKLSDVLAVMKHHNPGMHYILVGESGKCPGVGHVVLCKDDEIIHDPSGSGVVGPIDGYVWVELITRI